MESLAINIAAMIGGIALLVWGADRFVNGAASIARLLNVPALLIGLTIVALGTSAPEILVSAVAATQGNGGLAVGNALGSNITNIGLVLGFSAIVAPITVKSSLLKKEFPLLILVTVCTSWLMWNGTLSQLEGGLLLVGLIGLLAWLGWAAKQGDADQLAIDTDDIEELSRNAAIFQFVIGLATLLIGSRALVWGAVNTASSFGVSDTVIGLTIVALGTSLPELAASLSSALKGEHDLAIGNVVGSNLFNLLAVLGVAGAIQETEIATTVISTDIPLMLLLTAALVVMGMSWSRSRPGRINRFEASLLLASWIGWQAWTWITATA
ncbi:MAG: calcium/sodium antiporter [Gammaproteobacteria bacterium]|nr:calcium/sodium antiporter [Gammaproteobacteria bacterium]